MKWLANEQRRGADRAVGFTISADMTEPLHALCTAVPEAQWTLVEEQADETVTGAAVEFTPGDWPS